MGFFLEIFGRYLYNKKDTKFYRANLKFFEKILHKSRLTHFVVYAESVRTFTTGSVFTCHKIFRIIGVRDLDVESVWKISVEKPNHFEKNWAVYL